MCKDCDRNKVYCCQFVCASHPFGLGIRMRIELTDTDD